jgi:hypothetical protein
MGANIRVEFTIWASFARALYRLLALDHEQRGGSNPASQPVPPFEAVQELIEGYITDYLDHPGTLPYNGFDPVAYYTLRSGTPPPPEGVRSMLIQQTLLEELTRVWLEFSGVQDKTPYPLH